MIHIGEFDIRSDVFVLLLALVMLVIQLVFCLKIKPKWLRFAPLCLSLLCVAVFVVLAIIFDGWDAVGFLIIAIVAAAIAVGCIIGIAISAIIQKKKRRKRHAKENSLWE